MSRGNWSNTRGNWGNLETEGTRGNWASEAEQGQQVTPAWHQELMFNLVNPAMRGLQILNAPSVYGTQTFAAVQRNLEAIRGERPRQLYLPEYSPWGETVEGRYVNTEDPGQRLSLGAEISPLVQIERLIRGAETEQNQFISTGRATLPDTFEDAYNIISSISEHLSFETEMANFSLMEVGPEGLILPTTTGRVGLPQSELLNALIAGFWNEQTVAEMMSDPLFVLEAFGVGRRILDAGIVGIDAINRPAGAWRRAAQTLEGVPLREMPLPDRATHIMANRILSPTAEAAHSITGLAWRRVYRSARRPSAQAEYGIEQFAQQQGTQQEWLQRTLGQAGEVFEAETMPRITGMVETTPAVVRESFERMGEGLARVEAGAAAGEVLERGTIGFRELRSDVVDMVGREFQATDEVHDQIADILIDRWEASGLYPEASRLMGLPAENLVGDMGYIMRVTTSEARQARWRSLSPEMRRLYRWNMDNMPADNVLGKVLTDEAQGRNLRGLISEYTELAANGRVGYVDGTLKILKEGKKPPAGFIGVDKLLIDNPFQLATARFARHVRAMGARSFLGEASVNPVLLAREGIDEGFTLEALIKRTRGWGKGEYERTFDMLGPELQQIAENTKWRDLDTAFGVSSYMRVLQDMNFRPEPALVMIDRTVALWRGLTLTPFLSYHNRNIIGEMNNSLMSRLPDGRPGCDVFDLIDAMYPTANRRRLGKGDIPGWFQEFQEGGGTRLGMVRQEWEAVSDMARVDPLDPTPLRSGMSANPFDDRFAGRQVGMAVDQWGRFSQYVGARRRGLNHPEGMDMVFKYHYDYADIPPWFQHGTWARRVASFPIWTAKTIPLQLEHLITTPTWFATRGRLINRIRSMSPGDPPPEWAEKGGAVQMPDGSWFIPRNFDPAYTPAELMEPAEFMRSLFNPFVTEFFVEQPTATAVEQPYGAPAETVPTLPGYGEPTGYDYFRDQPIVKPYKEWNELLGGGRMPAWAQRTDHFLRSFLRAYNETGRFIREQQRIADETSQYVGREEEFAGQAVLGIPLRRFNPAQTIYFRVKDVDQDIGRIQGEIRRAGGTATGEQLSELKEYYSQKIAFLDHGTFMEIDPWTGNPRPWMDIAQDPEFTTRGRQRLFRDLLDTLNLMVYGRRGYGTQQLHQPIPLDDSEIASIQEMMGSMLDAYATIMYGADLTEEDINYQAEEEWLERRTPEMLELAGVEQ